MRILPLFLVARALFATTTITNIEATATQAVITVQTTQAGNCTYAASEGPFLTSALVHDVDTTLFPGSNSDARAGSVISANGVHKFVLGTRGPNGVQVSTHDNRAYSRALQQAAQATVAVTCGSDAPVSATFFTVNPAGTTYREPRFLRSNPGEYAYPSLPWSTRGVTTVDPDTGAGVRLAALPGDFLSNPNTAQTFQPNLIGGSGWSGSGQSWNYSGVSQGMLFLPITPLSTTSGSAVLSSSSTSGPTWAQLTATLSGSAANVLVCLTSSGVTCSGAQIAQPITATPTAYTIGSQTPILESWRSGIHPPIAQADIATQTGQVTKSGTSVTWTSGNLFLPTKWKAGSTITLGTTECAIASMQSDIQLTLASSGCVSDGTSIPYAATNFGFLIQAPSTTNVTIAVSSPSWAVGSSGYVGMPTAGWLSDVCQVTTTTGPTGPGNLCAPSPAYGPPNNYSTVPAIFWIGQDGTVNLIGLAWGANAPTGWVDGSCDVGNIVFDGLVPGKFYCPRVTTSGTFGMFSVQYSGAYTATNPSFSTTLPNSVSSPVTTDLNALVAAFDTSGEFAAFEAAYGGTVSWNVQSFENYGVNGAITLEGRFNHGGADSVGWWAIYSLPGNSDGNTIVAAMCTYCGGSGALNRWGGDHSGFGTRVGQTVFDTFNIAAPGYAVTTTGQLTSTFSACPANSFGATGNNCSTLTLGSLTPTSAQGTVPSAVSGSQQILLGDYLYTNESNGGQECIRVLTLSGLVAVVARSQFIGLGYCTVATNHAADLSMVMFPSLMHEMVWFWGTDPHGAAIEADPASSDCHYGFTMSQFVLGCLNAFIPQPEQQGNGIGKPIRLGPMPANITNPVFNVNVDAGFANSWAVYVAPSDNCMNSHPSATQENAPAGEQHHYVDNRPYGGFAPQCGGPTFITPTLVSGATYTYKIPAANLATLNYNYRVHSWMVTSGKKIAVDVSGPGSVLHDTQADWYKFCVVLIAGECVGGSSAGDVYVNFPYVSTVGPYSCYSGTQSGASQNDIDIAEIYVGLQGVQEVATDRGADFNGRGVRFLSSVFSERCSQSLFWNSREVGLGGWVYTTVDYLDGVNAQPVIVQKPPAPQVSSINWAEFLPLRLSFGGGTTGDTVKLQIGYGEYDQGQLAAGNVPPCNPRDEGCFTDSSGANPYVWASETQHATGCSAGCTVTANVLPAPGGRVTYFKRVRVNGATTIQGPLEIAVVGGSPVAFTNPGMPVTSTPTFSPNGGTYLTSQTVTISDPTGGSTIYYTLDGSTPTHSSSVYSTPLTISSTTTVKALGVTAGYVDSSVATAVYTISPSMTYVNGSSGQFNTGGAGTTTVSTAPFTVSAGNLLVCNAFWNNTNSVGLADGGDTFASVTSNTSGLAVGTIQQWYAKNTTSNASKVVTMTISSGGAGFAWIDCSQYAGASLTSPLDTFASGANSMQACGANAMTTGAFTTVNAVETLVGAFWIQFPTATPIAGTSYTLRDHTSDNQLWSQDQVVAGIQTGATTTFGTAACNFYYGVVGTYH
jgi:hypothetical protein